jgi:putative flippase GtrA
MLAPPNETPKATGLNHIAQQPGVRQFLKFGIIGTCNLVLNFGLSNLFHYKLDWPLIPALTVAFFLSALNGFFWNRRWTFQEARNKPAHTQSLQFLLVSLLGWLLNTTIVILIIASAQSHRRGITGGPEQFRHIVTAMLTHTGQHEYGPLLFNGALLIAAAVVVFWNFFANRFWTFKD